MAYYKNDTASALRVGGRRVRPGGVVRVNSGDEDAWRDAGASSASEDDFNAQNRTVSEGKNRERQRMNAYGDARAYANALLSAGAHEVVGDDNAPYGPPTGTITTKHAVMDQADGVERRQFGPGEWTAKEAEGRDLQPVQQAQADAGALADKIASQAVEGNFDVDPEDVKGLGGDEKRGGRRDSTPTARKKPGPKPRQSQQQQSQPQPQTPSQ